MFSIKHFRHTVIATASLAILPQCAHPTPATRAPQTASTSGSSATPTATPSPEDATLPIAPLRVERRAGNGWVPLVELRADGSLWSDGQRIGSVRGSSVLDAEDHVVFTRRPSGEMVAGNGTPVAMRVGARSIDIPGHASLEIQDDGTVIAITGGRRSEAGPIRFEHLPQSVGATAALVFVIALARYAEAADPRWASLAVPARAQGALEASDIALSDGSVCDDYRLTLRAGETVTIVVRGGRVTSSPDPAYPDGRLDMYAILMRRGTEVTHDDDSAGHFNPRIVYTATEAGDYTLRLTTYGSGLKTGAYEVETFVGARPTAE